MHAFADWLQATALSSSIKSASWLIPLLQSIHILTIGVVFVSSLMIVLRVLGYMRNDEAVGEVWQRFAPWMWGGVIVMGLTGLTLVVAEPVREFTTVSFWIKMLLVAVAVTGNALYGRSLMRVKRPAAVDFPLSAKAASLAIALVWLAIIFLGRAIAYDKEVWGSLSLHG
ncbi:MAG TPA: hypothetical protein VMG11_12545 [Steroidobacteraceae bacterium]|nr:hypothetical protein [Steroidobacteraceae bacterium]